MKEIADLFSIRIDAVIVLIVVTIGIIKAAILILIKKLLAFLGDP